MAIPVTDVDRAKAFYTDQAGFVAEHDHTVSEEIRFVQLTPPGSACSIAFGTGIVDSEPGSARGLQLVVADAHAARAELAGRGVEVSEVTSSRGARSCSSRTPTATAGPSSSCPPAAQHAPAAWLQRCSPAAWAAAGGGRGLASSASIAASTGAPYAAYTAAPSPVRRRS